MDPQSLFGILQGLLALVIVLVGINLYLVFRLREIDPFAKWNPNFINPALFMLFLVGGLIAAVVSTGKWMHLFSLTSNPASEHGAIIDGMFWRTMAVAIFVTIVTNTLLFYFPWRYRTKEGRKALHYAHNNRLEIIWTVVPAIVLLILIGDGVINWNRIMGDAPEDSVQVEVNAKQFAWTIRYPGEDMKFGDASVAYMEEGINDLGFNFEDANGYDDIVTTEMYLPVDVPVEIKIKSRDVLHSMTLSHFRVKMDAVPGMPTSFWFTPTMTTAEMREKRQEEDFVYELSCQQICGSGHWNMRRVVTVVTMEEYKRWLAAQKPFYNAWLDMNPEKNQAGEMADLSKFEANGNVLAEGNQ